MLSSDLFPPLEAALQGYLEVGEGHRIYWEVSGAASGLPALFLHGGPGAGSSAEHRRFFNPARYRIVVHDQRGAGRSEPLGGLAGNTTQNLIEDIEKLRQQLEIERWLVFGGSWGSTLALAYAQRHPSAVLALVLRGIFLGTREEAEWFLTGMGRFFPEARARFVETLPEGERGDLLGAYLARLTDPDPEVHMPAARAWARYEAACCTLLPSPETLEAFSSPRLSLGLARLEAHYFAHDCFLQPNELLDNIGRIRHIPAVIVQGRYDVVCPIGAADRLHRAWPEAEYHVIPDAGHSGMEPGIRRALVAATERLADRLGG